MRISDWSSDVCSSDLLGATTYYNRLAQRVTAAMSVPTAAGKLYDIDTRLRPQGAQGPLVVTLDSFERYQRERSDERRVGKECVRTCRSRWSPYHTKKKT